MKDRRPRYELLTLVQEMHLHDRYGWVANGKEFPSSREALLDWAEFRRVAVLGWEDKHLVLTRLEAHEYDESLVRGYDENNLAVVESWCQHWVEI